MTFAPHDIQVKLVTLVLLSTATGTSGDDVRKYSAVMEGAIVYVEDINSNKHKVIERLLLLLVQRFALCRASNAACSQNTVTSRLTK